MFFRTPFFLPWVYPGLTWRIPVEDKRIYLTFDDGPVPGPTEFVLDTLKSFRCKATFFCIGDNVRKHPSVFKRIIDEGHVVGNHTFNHVKGWSHSTDHYVQNVLQCEQQLKDSDYQIPAASRPLFRPPYGRITSGQIRSLTHYTIVMWDVLTSDYNQHLNAARCLQGSIGATRAGSVVVFHDSAKAEKNMSYALPRYIEHFLKLGFTFDVISVPQSSVSQAPIPRH